MIRLTSRRTPKNSSRAPRSQTGNTLERVAFFGYAYPSQLDQSVLRRPVMGLMKDLYMVLGILSIGFGGVLLLGSHEIWRLYFNGPETCTFAPPMPQGDPPCGDIVTTVAILAAVGGFLVGIGPLLLLISRDGTKPPTLSPTATTS